MPSTSLVPIKRILFVDDDAEVRRSFSLLLSARGFGIRTFETGTELLDREHVDQKACFLLDYRLPDMNGIELLLSLRHIGKNNPAFLITGDPHPSIGARAFTAGFLGVIDKPADTNRLAHLLNTAIDDL